MTLLTGTPKHTERAGEEDVVVRRRRRRANASRDAGKEQEVGLGGVCGGARRADGGGGGGERDSVTRDPEIPGGDLLLSTIRRISRELGLRGGSQ